MYDASAILNAVGLSDGSRMRSGSFCLGFILSIAAGCSGPASSPPQDTSLPGGTDINPYGATYPSDGLGTTPRAGSTPGSRLRNHQFRGYRNPAASKELATISIADFYDPEARKYKVIHLSAASVWCGPCARETEDTVSIAESMAAKGVVFVQALIDGPATGTGATQQDLDGWTQRFRSPFPSVLDPRARNLGEFFDPASVPWNANVDARSMEILSASVGAPADVAADVAKWLDWVNSNPPLKGGS